MARKPNHSTGALIIDYARAKWGKPPAPETAERIGPKLGRDLQLRLDVLGIDGEHMLGVEPQDALLVLEELEREAELENFQAAVRDDPFEGGATVQKRLPGSPFNRPNAKKAAKPNTQGASRRRNRR